MNSLVAEKLKKIINWFDFLFVKGYKIFLELFAGYCCQHIQLCPDSDKNGHKSRKKMAKMAKPSNKPGQHWTNPDNAALDKPGQRKINV